MRPDEDQDHGGHVERKTRNVTDIQLYRQLGIRKKVLAFAEDTEKQLKDRFAAIDEMAEYNQLKVIRAMQENRVSEACFNYASGYGYNDQGRDTLERVYAGAFPHGERSGASSDRLRHPCALPLPWPPICGPGDELLSPAGKPYDTLEEVIGIRPSNGSLAEYGVTYRQVDLLPDGTFDYETIRKAINEKTKLVTIQRSKGYQTRPSFSVAQIGELIAFVKKIRPDVICMVDNCYGEFVERAGAQAMWGRIWWWAPSSRTRAAAWRPSAGTLRERGTDRELRLSAHLPGPGTGGGGYPGRHAVLLPGTFPGAHGGRPAP